MGAYDFFYVDDGALAALRAANPGLTGVRRYEEAGATLLLPH